MTSHDATIQTMSHLNFEFEIKIYKFGAKLLLFSEICKFFIIKLQIVLFIDLYQMENYQ